LGRIKKHTAAKFSGPLGYLSSLDRLDLRYTFPRIH